MVKEKITYHYLNQRLTNVFCKWPDGKYLRFCRQRDKIEDILASLSMDFSGWPYWGGFPFPSMGDLPNLGIEPWSPALQADSLPSEPPGKYQIFEALQAKRLNWGYYVGSYTRREKINFIKKNTFESVLMRWMKLEPIIQSEVSQKEKHQYSILTHIYGI